VSITIVLKQMENSYVTYNKGKVGLTTIKHEHNANKHNTHKACFLANGQIRVLAERENFELMATASPIEVGIITGWGRKL